MCDAASESGKVAAAFPAQAISQACLDPVGNAMEQALAAAFARRSEEAIPSLIREDASLWEGVAAKIATQAAEEASTFVAAYGEMFQVKDTTPTAIIEFLATLPLDRAADVEAELGAAFLRFWDALPEVVRATADREAVARQWRLQDGIAHIRSWLEEGPKFRCQAKFPATEPWQQELLGKITSAEDADTFEQRVQKHQEEAIMKLPEYLRSKDLEAKVEEKTILGSKRFVV